jgi:hypothetical protein
MKVEFEADYKDFAEISYLAWEQHSATERIFPYLYIYLLFPTICTVPVFLFVKEFWWAGILTFLFVFLLSLYFFRFPSLTRNYKEFIKVLGAQTTYPIEIEFSESGIRLKQIGDEYLFGWENIVSVLETKKRLCFFTRNKVGISIPIRAFDSMDEQTNFLIFGKSRMSQELTK